MYESHNPCAAFFNGLGGAIEPAVLAYIESPAVTRATQFLAQLERVDLATLFGTPLGERLCRVLQRQTARRVPQRGDLHHPGRGPSPQRTLAAGIQPAAAPQAPSATGPPAPPMRRAA